MISLKESRSALRTISDGSLFQRTVLLGKKTACNMLRKYGSAYKREVVHVTDVSLGVFKINWYLYCHMAMYNFIVHDYTGINAPIVVIRKADSGK